MVSLKKNTVKGDESGFCDSFQIIDANLNRTKEGLRVCEDICRFHLKNTAISKSLSNMRHRLTAIIKNAKCDPLMLIQHRDASGDIGKAFSLGPKRKAFKGIFLANAQRVKESLRVLEEFMKLFDVTASKKIQKLRFDFYDFEKKVIQRFPSLLDTR